MIAAGEVDQLQLGEFGIGDGDERAISAADPGRSQADLFNRAANRSKLTLLANPDRLVGEQHNPGNQVFGGVLGRQCHSQPAHSQSGHQWGDRYSHPVDGMEDNPGCDPHGSDAAHQTNQLAVDGIPPLAPGFQEPLGDAAGRRQHADDHAGERDRLQAELCQEYPFAGQAHLKREEVVDGEAAGNERRREDK